MIMPAGPMASLILRMVFKKLDSNVGMDDDMATLHVSWLEGHSSGASNMMYL